MIYIGCAALIILYFVLYAVFGKLFFAFCKKVGFEATPYGWMEQILIGYFCYFFCFYVLSIPLKFLGASLTALTILWVLALVAAVVGWLVIRKEVAGDAEQSLTLPRKYTLFYAAILFLLVTLMNVNMQTGALWDESHYVGEVTTSIYTDSLSGYDVYTGKKTKDIDEEYLLEITETHSAVMCSIFPIPPSVEVRTVRATVNIILFYLLIILMGQSLFVRVRENVGENDAQIKASLFFCIFVGLDLFSYNLHTRAQILIYRAFEGKAILANIIIFSIFYVFLKIFRNSDNRTNWAMMFLVVASSFGLNMTSLILVPALLGALLIPFILSGRRWKFIPQALICLIPWVPEVVFYLVLH